MSPPRLLVMGNANVDLVLGEVDGWPAIGTEVMVERSEMRPGGSAGNAALALTGMGAAHRFIASVGDDPNGAWLRAQFEPGVTDCIVYPGATTVTVGIVHRGGDRAFFTTPGHLQTARLEDILDRVPQAPAGPAFALVSGGFLMPAIEAETDRLLDALAAAGWRTAIDPGWPTEGWSSPIRDAVRGWLRRSDIALLNEEEVAALGEAGSAEGSAERLAAQMRQNQILVMKRGADGATAWHDGTRSHVPAPRVAVVDTVGAGDCFNAGLLDALARGDSVEAALGAGIAVASHAISTYPRSYRPA